MKSCIIKLRTAVLLAFSFLSLELHALSAKDTAHLLDRTAFGVHTPELQLDWASLSRPDAIQHLLDSSSSRVDVPPPLWLFNSPNQALKNIDMDSELKRKLRNEYNRVRREWRKEAKHWWLEQIDQGKSPFTERLVLFWQNHFSVEITGLPAPQLALLLQLTIRQHASGNYRDMLQAINRDPALLIYLNNNKNNKRKPNENYARELLELFALGEGHYTEEDIKELSRAMTGAGIGPSYHYKFNINQHDKGMKDLFGKRAEFKPHKVIDQILKQPRAAEFLVENLWQEFISETPEPSAVSALAQLFRQADYALEPLLKALLNRPEFWAAENRAKLVKSPVELLLSEHYRLGIAIEDYALMSQQLAAMGQDLFDPPNVAGWPQHQAWINSDSLIKRSGYLLKLRQQHDAATAAQVTFEDQLK